MKKTTRSAINPGLKDDLDVSAGEDVGGRELLIRSADVRSEDGGWPTPSDEVVSVIFRFRLHSMIFGHDCASCCFPPAG